MKKVAGFQNWKHRWKKQNIENLLPGISGHHNLRYLNTTVFLLLSFFGYMQKTGIEHQLIVMMYTGLFAILAICNLIIKTYYMDIISDLILGLIVLFSVSYGNITAVLFFILISYHVQNKYQYYVIGGLLLCGIIYTSTKYGNTPFQIGAVIVGYSFFILKYIFTIHIPVQNLKNQIKKLTETIINLKKEIAQLKSLIKTSLQKPMSDDEILERYPFMMHSGDNPYRKIQDLRLFADQNGYKQIGSINGISANTQSREFNNMKENFSKEVQRKIITVQGLVIAGIELGIIQVKNIHY